MFSLRIVTVNHYQAPPIGGLDVAFSDFRGAEVKHVPVVRVFGSTPAGQHACLHVHGAFPYIYVGCGLQEFTADKDLLQFATSLDLALQVAMGKGSGNTHHVFKIVGVKAVPMYGYHSRSQRFLKIYFYNPLMVKRAVELLQSGAVLNKVFQPHEAHIPYILQFFIDYNLFGMNLLHLAAVKFRREKDDANGEGSQGSTPDTQPLSTVSSPSSQTIHTRMWTKENITSDLLLGVDVERQSVCKLEVDAVAMDILNRHDLQGNTEMNPGLLAIYEEERERRELHGQLDELHPPSSPDRGVIEDTPSDLAGKQRLAEIIRQQMDELRAMADGDDDKDDDSPLHDTMAAGPSMTASQLIVHDSQFAGDDSAVFTPEESQPVINEELVQAVVEASQKASHYSQQGPDGDDDANYDLAQLLVDLAHTTATPEDGSLLSSQETQEVKTAEQGVKEDGEDVDESIEMSQVWDLDSDNEESGDVSCDNPEVEIVDRRSDDGSTIPQYDGGSDEKPASESQKNTNLEQPTKRMAQEHPPAPNAPPDSLCTIESYCSLFKPKIKMYGGKKKPAVTEPYLKKCVKLAAYKASLKSGGNTAASEDNSLSLSDAKVPPLIVSLKAVKSTWTHDRSRGGTSSVEALREEPELKPTSDTESTKSYHAITQDPDSPSIPTDSKNASTPSLLSPITDHAEESTSGEVCEDIRPKTNSASYTIQSQPTDARSRYEKIHPKLMHFAELKEISSRSLGEVVKDPQWNPVLMLIKWPIETNSRGKIVFSGTSLPRQQLERIRRDDLKAKPRRRSSTSRKIVPPKRFMDEQYWTNMDYQTKSDHNLCRDVCSNSVGHVLEDGNKRKPTRPWKSGSSMPNLDRTVETNVLAARGISKVVGEGGLKCGNSPWRISSQASNEKQDMPTLERIEAEEYGDVATLDEVGTGSHAEPIPPKSSSGSLHKKGKPARKVPPIKLRAKSSKTEVTRKYEMLSQSFKKLGLLDEEMNEAFFQEAQRRGEPTVGEEASTSLQEDISESSMDSLILPSYSGHSPNSKHSNQKSSASVRSKKNSLTARKRRRSDSSDDWSEVRTNSKHQGHKRQQRGQSTAIKKAQIFGKSYGFRKRERVSYDDGDFPDVGFDIMSWSDEEENASLDHHSTDKAKSSNNMTKYGDSAPCESNRISEVEKKVNESELVRSPRRRGRPRKKTNIKASSSEAPPAKSSPLRSKPKLSFAGVSPRHNGTGHKLQPSPTGPGIAPPASTPHLARLTPSGNEIIRTNDVHEQSHVQRPRLLPLTNGLHVDCQSNEGALYRDAMWNLGYFSPCNLGREGSPPRCWSPNEDTENCSSAVGGDGMPSGRTSPGLTTMTGHYLSGGEKRQSGIDIQTYNRRDTETVSESSECHQTSRCMDSWGNIPDNNWDYRHPMRRECRSDDVAHREVTHKLDVVEKQMIDSASYPRDSRSPVNLSMKTVQRTEGNSINLMASEEEEGTSQSGDHSDMISKNESQVGHISSDEVSSDHIGSQQAKLGGLSHTGLAGLSEGQGDVICDTNQSEPTGKSREEFLRDSSLGLDPITKFRPSTPGEDGHSRDSSSLPDPIPESPVTQSLITDSSTNNQQSPSLPTEDNSTESSRFSLAPESSENTSSISTKASPDVLGDSLPRTDPIDEGTPTDFADSLLFGATPVQQTNGSNDDDDFSSSSDTASTGPSLSLDMSQIINHVPSIFHEGNSSQVMVSTLPENQGGRCSRLHSSPHSIGSFSSEEDINEDDPSSSSRKDYIVSDSQDIIKGSDSEGYSQLVCPETPSSSSVGSTNPEKIAKAESDPEQKSFLDEDSRRATQTSTSSRVELAYPQSSTGDTHMSELDKEEGPSTSETPSQMSTASGADLTNLEGSRMLTLEGSKLGNDGDRIDESEVESMEIDTSQDDTKNPGDFAEVSVDLIREALERASPVHLDISKASDEGQSSPGRQYSHVSHREKTSSLPCQMFDYEPANRSPPASQPVQARLPQDATAVDRQTTPCVIPRGTFPAPDQFKPRTASIPAHRKRRAWMPAQSPPSPSAVRGSLESLNLPDIYHKRAFCRNPEDISRHIGQGVHYKSHLESILPSHLPKVESGFTQSGLSQWQANLMALKPHPLLTDTDPNAENSGLLKAALLEGDTNTVITPARLPPRREQVERWLAEGKIRTEKEVDEWPGTRNARSKDGDQEPRSTQTSGDANPPSSLHRQREGEVSTPHRVPPGCGPAHFAVTPTSKPLDSPRVNPLLRRGESRLQHSTPVRVSVQTGETHLPLTPISGWKKPMECPLTGQPSMGSQANAASTSMRQSLSFTPKEGSGGRAKDISQIEGATPNNTCGFKMAKLDMQKAKAVHEAQHLTTMSLELHVKTRRDYYPDPDFDPIRALFYSIHHDTSATIHGVIIVDDSNHGDDEPPASASSDKPSCILAHAGVHNIHTTTVPSETGLLDQILAVIKEHDPDILVGYEIQRNSWGYLLERAAFLGVDLCTQISRLPDFKKESRFSPERDAYGADNQSEITIAGRITLNLWRIMRHEVALTNYTFENVAFHVLHQRIPLFSYRRLTEWFDHRFHHLYRWRVVEFYSIRVRGSLTLLHQLDLIGRTSELARVFGIQFYSVLSRGSQYRVESMMLRTAKPQNYVAMSPNTQQRSRMKAPECIPLVMEPESRFYQDPVIVLDFQSLYPSIMIAYNYCYSTCLGRVEHIANGGEYVLGCGTRSGSTSQLNKLLQAGNLHVSPNGVVFVKQEVRRGVLPTMLEQILNLRLIVKRSLKDYKDDKTLRRMLHSRQLALKLIANVTYGYTSANYSGRMPCVEVADSVVRKGRETLERAINLVETTKKWRARVVYGDTDSMFVLVEGASRQRAFEVGRQIRDAVTAANPKPVKLKLEKVYHPCVLQSKKRYVGYSYETPEQEEPDFDAKGIETVRRDSCPAVGKILERALKILFTSRDVSQVKQYVQTQFQKIVDGRATMQDLIFAKEYRGKHTYRPGACVPALEISRRLLAVDRRAEPRVGQRVPYVVVHGSPGLPLIQLVRMPQQVLQDPSLRLNTTYYLTRQLVPTLNRVFGLLGVDIMQWYQELPRWQRVSVHHQPGTPGKKGTISQYFSSVNCVICEKATQSSLCQECRGKGQVVISDLLSRVRQWQRVQQDMSKICSSCCNFNEENGESCVSLDCPVMFKTNKVLRQLGQATHYRQLIEEL